MINSTFWLIMIIVGVVFVAVGNIKFTIAREAETKKELAAQALNILRPEIARNRDLIGEFRRIIPQNKVPIQTFDTTAWETVSGSELIRGLVDERLPQWLKAYHLINTGNALHARLIELAVGIGSALGNRAETRTVWNGEILRLMDELEPAINALLGDSDSTAKISTPPQATPAPQAAPQVTPKAQDKAK